jgi:hypothetical protein
LTDQPRRLIEVSLPLKAISAQSAREKSIRHGHISTLHIWWARRPLAAMRAAIFASLVPAPESDAERQELEDLIATIVDWDQVKHGNSPKVLEARQRVLDAFDGRPPRLLDPFMGGGATGLEALRHRRRLAEPPVRRTPWPRTCAGGAGGCWSGHGRRSATCTRTPRATRRSWATCGRGR